MGSVAKYEEIREKVKGMIQNRVQIATPQPMDIGNVGAGDSRHNHGEGHDYSSEDDAAIDAVTGISYCLRCGGQGHFARECGTPMGKGKGEVKGKCKCNDGQQQWQPKRGCPSKGAGKLGAWSKGGKSRERISMLDM